MKWLLLLAGFFPMVLATADSGRVYLLSKRQILNSNMTTVVFFYDRSVTSIAECEREIQRGIRGQWRYYTHKFPTPKGYLEKLDYYCVQTGAVISPWYDKAPYDFVYQIDIRHSTSRIKAMPHYAECLRDLRQQIHDETRHFFCAKVSQEIRF
ncbi:hypothetical protein DWB84_13085 [Saccharophagus sp. K07]|uniref:hypothetical protein n=1 Tax=Saccharophagus sp. K07 TaxID=2283636 RepID=UPI0016528637|nr:hypothetical protein [Saccharophagus sp. K07]MBC6906391.1 hypothetical protein [Saccharophagus sp. K07]